MAFLQTTAASISSGGTINGDLTISGDLTVTGVGGGFAYTEVITGDVQINGPEGTGAASAGVLVLSTAEETVRVGTVDQLGRIDFQAPSEGGEGDANLVGASIYAVAAEDFSSTNNSTALVLSTGTTSAPIERMRIDQDGNTKLSGQVTIESLTAKLTIKNTNTSAGDAELDLVSDNGASNSDWWKIIADGDSAKDLSFQNYSTSFYVSHLVLDANSRISLSNNDSGTSNTIFGKNAGLSLDDGSNYNVFIGEDVSNAAMVDATWNVGVGYNVLGALTTGDFNTCVGGQAGLNITDGTHNTFLGQAAGEISTSITYAVGVGVGALGGANATADAIGTVAVGYQSLTALTTGAGNVAVGYQSLDSETAGDGNTAIGYTALSAQNDGDLNTAVGYEAGLSHTTGSSGWGGNTFIGGKAGKYNGAGRGNTFVGAEAATGVSSPVLTGNYNSAFGVQSGVALQGAAHENTFFGAYAGDVLETGSDNTCIGTQADTDDATAVNQTVIGHSTTGVADNSVTLGNADVTDVYMAQDKAALVHCGPIIGLKDEITATNSGVAASLFTLNTEVTTNGDEDLDNVTLANPNHAGQMKNIYCTVEGHANDTWKITPATMCGGTQITFAGVGLGCTLVYAFNEGWVVVGNNGGTIS